MSSSDQLLRNDEYGWIDSCAADLLSASKTAVATDLGSRISDEAVQHLFTAAIRLYVAKADGEGRTFRPILGREGEELTATEVLSATSELLRSLHLGPVELALWFRRRPEE